MENSEISILVVDDEYSVRNSLKQWFETDGFVVDTVESAEEAMDKLARREFDIVLLDVKLPGMDGVQLNSRIHQVKPDTIVIIMTAYASIESAVQTLKDGAFDYVIKPIDPDNLSHIVRNAIERRMLKLENMRLRRSVDTLLSAEYIVGESPQIKEVLNLISQVAPTDTTVMIRGESGTGKELVAKAIHANSRRRYGPLIVVNCGAVTDTLLESELFGHEKGAFTGAVTTRRGKLELADKGTIFFDEIGNISEKMQLDLLRVLETKEFTRLGGTKTIKSDFRVISATNRDLEKAVKEGTFRQDLYFRLAVFTIDLPPLRERDGDIRLLAEYFLQQFARAAGKDIRGFTKEAMRMLESYSWPGNVRELKNVVERAVVVSKAKEIRPEDLSFPFGYVVAEENDQDMSLEAMEMRHIKKVLTLTRWNISKAAQILGIDRTTLYSKIKKYGLSEKG